MDIPSTRREIARWMVEVIESLGLNPLFVFTIIFIVWPYLIYRKMDSWKEADWVDKASVIVGAFMAMACTFALVAFWISN